MSNVKKNYRKIENKKDNDVDADVTQLERSNNKYYASAFRDIYIYIYIYKNLHVRDCPNFGAPDFHSSKQVHLNDERHYNLLKKRYVPLMVFPTCE